MDLLVVVVLAIVAIVAVTSLAPRVGVAAPLVLVLLGVGVSFLPFVPAIEIEPEWILGVVLPPLLYSAAVGMPTMDFRRDFRIISSLSVVLVVVSTVAVGFVMTWLVPGMSLAAGFALGAIVSPTDAVATSVVRKAGVSPRIVTVLEGESMLNDASALVLLRSATAVVAATVSTLSPAEVAGEFARSVALAVVIGYLVGRLNLLVRARIAQPTSSVAISLVVPFVAYLPAEHLEASGLVAAVTAGLVSGSGAARHLSAEDRITERVVWRTLELLLESAVFLIMGLELFGLVETLLAEDGSLLAALGLGAVAALLVMVIRSAFVGVAVWRQARRARRNPGVRERLSNMQDQMANGGPDGRVRPLPARRGADPEKVQQRTRKRISRITTALTQRIADIDYLTAEAFGPREAAVLIWAGMRGAVTLAAAQSLPPQTPQRSLLVLVAFVVAAGTLLVQGGTLPWVVRRLRLTDGEHGDGPVERAALRAELTRVAVDRLASPDLATPEGTPYSAQTLDHMQVRAWLPAEGEPDDGDGPTAAARYAEIRALRLDLLAAQRQALLHIRDVGTYSSAALAAALTQLDAIEIGINLRDDDLRDDGAG